LDIEDDGDSHSAAHLEINTGLNLTVYVAKEYAEKAQRQAGGIILEVNAACLADVEGEFGNDILLTAGASYEGTQSSSACISVCYDGLPYKMVPNYGPYEAGTVEPQGDIAEFGTEAEAWITKLEEETGFELHQ
jgi:hypothetical protein